MTAHPPRTPPPGWYPDPHDESRDRWWNGDNWTPHLRVAEDPTRRPSDGRSLFNEPTLMIGMRTVLDQHGNLLGEVRGVRPERRVLGFTSPSAPQKFQVIDSSGRHVLTLISPATLLNWRQVIVQDGHGQEIGQIVRQPLMRRARAWLQNSLRPSIELVAGGATIGSIERNSGSLRFLVRDASGAEIARMIYARPEAQVHQPLPEPLRTLVVASTLAEIHGLMLDTQGGGGG